MFFTSNPSFSALMPSSVDGKRFSFFRILDTFHTCKVAAEYKFVPVVLEGACSAGHFSHIVAAVVGDGKCLVQRIDIEISRIKIFHQPGIEFYFLFMIYFPDGFKFI